MKKALIIIPIILCLLLSACTISSPNSDLSIEINNTQQWYFGESENDAQRGSTVISFSKNSIYVSYFSNGYITRGEQYNLSRIGNIFILSQTGKNKFFTSKFYKVKLVKDGNLEFKNLKGDVIPLYAPNDNITQPVTTAKLEGEWLSQNTILYFSDNLFGSIRTLSSNDDTSNKYFSYTITTNDKNVDILTLTYADGTKDEYTAIFEGSIDNLTLFNEKSSETFNYLRATTN